MKRGHHHYCGCAAEAAEPRSIEYLSAPSGDRKIGRPAAGCVARTNFTLKERFSSSTASTTAAHANMTTTSSSTVTIS